MKTILEEIAVITGDAFEKAGYDRGLGRVVVSNRPDLCEYQCNGAMAGAKQYHEAPAAIAEKVREHLADHPMIRVSVAPPGFLNITLREGMLASYLFRVAKEKKLGVEAPEVPPVIVLDYGGPNVAKPLHVGHLRSAVIGEALKRLLRYAGATVTGDIHMGDWGLPMGLIIAWLEDHRGELPYFDPSHTGPYPKEAPFTVTELEEIYPAASARAKEEEPFRLRAMEITHRLQEGDKGYRALWKHIKNVSTSDLKRNYDRLEVSFDLWKGESDVEDRMPPMVDEMVRTGVATESEGALIIDVKEEGDTREIPPCIIRKSDGAALYATSDLATIAERMEEFRPDELLYITDKRQEMHFIQVFRAARKARLVFPETKLTHIGFGTMNGKDGKPFKTRDGGVPRLEDLLNEIEAEMGKRITESGREMDASGAEEVMRRVALSALKYGDLSNQPSKDYVFDPEKFTAFEGDTGPYLLYSVVRIKSVLKKYDAQYPEEFGGKGAEKAVFAEEDYLAASPAQKELGLKLAGFAESVTEAAWNAAPNRLCAFLYALANACNSFYHETKVLTETDPVKRRSYVASLVLALRELETGISLLGFSAPDQM